MCNRKASGPSTVDIALTSQRIEQEQEILFKVEKADKVGLNVNTRLHQKDRSNDIQHCSTH